jgi:hypothetical protein
MYDTMVRSAAAECLKLADGDVTKATPNMKDRLLQNEILYHKLMDPFLQHHCYEVIRKLCREAGRPVWETPRPSEADRKMTIKGEAIAAELVMASYEERSRKERSRKRKVR